MNKWPNSITAIRHVKSSYNEINHDEIPGYLEFAALFDYEVGNLNLEIVANNQFPSPRLKKLALALIPKLSAATSDYDTPAANNAVQEQAVVTGQKLMTVIEKPHQIYVSPYKRTHQTLEGLTKGWPALSQVTTVEDDRIREQEYGTEAIYNDLRLYFVFNPQRALSYKLSSPYEYRHESGENLPDLRNRGRSFLSMLIREHGGLDANVPEDILLITHHRIIMALRANVEHWTREQFINNDQSKRPPNCSITSYDSVETGPERSRRGRLGRLVLKHENLVLY